MLKRKLFATAAGLVIAGGLGLAAGAIPAHAAATPAGTYYSSYLGGYAATSVLQGLNDIRATIHVPSESTSVVPDQTVAGGLTLATGINGGDALGIGLVWNAKGGSGACTAADDANTWELEYTNSVKIDTPALEPVPLNLLTELPVGGSPVCLAGNSSYYLEMYYSTYHHTVAFIAGPQEFVNENVLATIDHVHGVFFAAGAGVDTTNGPDAADLTTGTLASFTRVGLDNLDNVSNPKSGTKRITFDAATTYAFVGTETGGSPSVSNLETLIPGGFGSGSAFGVTVP